MATITNSTPTGKAKFKENAKAEFDRVFFSLKNAKARYTKNWTKIEEQINSEALSETRSDGTPKSKAINFPIEQQYIQAGIADEFSRPPVYDIIARDEVSKDKIDVLKAVDDHLEFEDNFHNKLISHGIQKKRFGWSVMFDGYSESKQKVFSYNAKGEKESRVEITRRFYSRVVDPRFFFIDNVANIEDAENAIEIEYISEQEFLRRYKDNSFYNQKVVKDIIASEIKKESGEGSNDSDNPGIKIIKIEHFWRRADSEGGRYAVFANDQEIRDGTNPNPLGWLPYSLQADIRDPSSIIGGKGIPELISQHKEAINKLFDAYSVQSRAAASPTVISNPSVSWENPEHLKGQNAIARLKSGSINEITTFPVASPSNSALESINLLYNDLDKLIGYNPAGLSQENPSESATKVLAREEQKRSRVAIYDREFSAFFKRMKQLRLANIMAFFPLPIVESSGEYKKKLKDGALVYPSVMVKGTVKYDKDEKGNTKKAFIEKGDSDSLLEVSPAVIRANIDVKVRNGSNRPVFKNLETAAFKENLETARILYADLAAAKASGDEEAIEFAENTLEEFARITDFKLPDSSSNNEDFAEMAEEAKSLRGARRQYRINGAGAVQAGGTPPQQMPGASPEAALGGEIQPRPEAGGQGQEQQTA